MPPQLEGESRFLLTLPAYKQQARGRWNVILALVVSLHRNLECLNLLLNIGADFNRKDNFGR